VYEALSLFFKRPAAPQNKQEKGLMLLVYEALSFFLERPAAPQNTLARSMRGRILGARVAAYKYAGTAVAN
jgi:hypothetical protein